MQSPITAPWGKLSRGREAHDADPAACLPATWHPLVHHCLDVAAVFLGLMERTLLGRRLAAVAGLEALSEAQVWRLAWLAYLHDVGKLNAGFQARASGGPPIGHVEPVRGLFDREHLREAWGILRLDALNAPGQRDALTLLGVAVAHHGAPLVGLGKLAGDAAALWRPTAGYDPLAALDAHVADGARALAPAFTDAPERLPCTAGFTHALAGVIMLADWVASDDRVFTFSESLDDDRFSWARETAGRVLVDMGLDTTVARGAAPSSGGLARILGEGRAARPMQSHVEALPADDGYSAVVLESDTGSGKTEAAVARFLRLLAAGQVDGLYFALPTRAAAVQIHQRVVRALRDALGDAAPPVVLAVPGYLRVDETDGHRPLPGFNVLWPDDAPRARTWAAEHPKRFLAAAVAVGTVDQVLLSVLQVPHAHLRAGALSRLLLVVDEVHASDPYMTALLSRVLDRMRAARGHVLLMSATLGGPARRRLLFQPPEMSQEDAAAQPYPLVSIGRANGTVEALRCPPHTAGPRRVMVEPLPLYDDPAAVAAHALGAARQGARVLVLRNTVTSARDTQQALEQSATKAGDDDLLFRCARLAAPHHSRFGPADRRALDGRVEELFGAARSDVPVADGDDQERRAGVVLVATQTVEQSLDIDADLLLTDLCPADVLLQRLGRLHRHASRPRQRDFQVPRALVLVPAERDLTHFAVRGQGAFGLGRDGVPRAYPDMRVLEATWRQIERYPLWELPRMNRALVEAATHPEALDALSAELGDTWVAHGQTMAGVRIAEEQVARLGCVDHEEPYGASAFPADLMLATRLGARDRDASFADPPPSLFDPASPLPRLTIPHWMAGGIPAEAEPQVTALVTGPEPSLSFTLGPAAFTYDRLGLRRDAP